MHAVADSVTMVWRDLVHLRRDPSPTVLVVVVPVLLLLYGGPALAPGVLLVTAAGAGYVTARSIATDLTGGVAARLRTMAIRRTSLLVGHVVGGAVAAGWCVAVSLGSLLWARRLYARRPVG